MLLINVSLFPFQNLKFFGQKELLNVVDYDKDDSSVAKTQREKSYKNLHHQIENEILRKVKPRSLDEVDLLLQKFYPMLVEKDIDTLEKWLCMGNAGERPFRPEKRLYQHYFKIMEEFAHALISYRDGAIIFKYWKNDKHEDKKWHFIDFMKHYEGQDKVHFFHAISRFVPLDLMIALHHSKNNIHDPQQLYEFYQHINLADASLDDILCRGVAENHIHASAAFNFSILWQATMNGQSPKSYLQEFQSNHLATPVDVEAYILTARLFRMIMALYLKDQMSMVVVEKLNSNTVWMPLFEWVRKNLIKDEAREKLIEILQNQNTYFEDPKTLKQVIEYVELNFLYTKRENSEDFIFDIFPEHIPIKTYGENLFLHLVMAYRRKIESIRDDCGHFEAFFRVFFKYVSIKNEFYQQVTQPTFMHGLDFFRYYFDRATDGIEKNKNYYKTMLRTLFQDRYLHKVELRISIKDNEVENRAILQSILSSYQEILNADYHVESLNGETQFPLLGIVYHLIKKPDSFKKNSELYDHNYEDTTLRHLHFGELQESYINQVKQLQKLRKNVPMATNFIVGLDAASLENNTPIQVFAPVFEVARDSQYDALKITDPDGRIMQRQSLFFTFHAGEEFRHLNSGLRRMDEVIDYCKFHAGDRIGHGIALGIDIEQWVQSNPLVILPRGEYLDNLLWVWDVYSRITKLETETLVYLERKIEEVSNVIFSGVSNIGEWKISLLHAVYKRRFKRIKDEVEKLNVAKCENYKQDISSNLHKSKKEEDADLLFACYHEESTLRKMKEPIYVRINENERLMMIDMQKYLIRKIAEIGIIIEVNPSSNEAIGEIDSIFGNQLFCLQSAGNPDLANIRVNVNSDDPMIFNTNVSNELVYMYYGMLQQGMGREAALDWIEKLRKSGMDTSFIRGTRSRQEYLSILSMTIEALKNPLYV